MSHCPILRSVDGPFQPEKRPHLVAAMLSARPSPEGYLIDPPTGKRWFYRDARELVARGWGRHHKMRADRLWIFRLTEAGIEQRQRLWAGQVQS